jgi:ABC-type nitrate/sulfonate/bicarbonate transport system substrate-binding protein
MRSVKLAYRDDDRTPVIFCIKEMARRYYDVDLEVVQIKGGKEYEAALFDGSADIIVEHLEYLYDEAAKGRKVTIFCAPSRGGSLELVTAPRVRRPEDLKSGVMAVRTSGQPHAVTLWLRMMGLENEVKTLPVEDSEVGRWGQWKRVASGDCVATFMSPLYLPQALAAGGLRILAVPDIPIVGHYAQACLARFAEENSPLLKDYMRSVIHAICLMIFRRDEALKIVADEPMKRMKVETMAELERQFDSIVKWLKAKPYPSARAIANSYEIATLEYPDAKGLNPLSLWDLHWVRELDDEGFIDTLIRNLEKAL